MMRIIWGACGAVALLLGMIGIALPLVPTVPFLLLAAFCWSKASTRWHAWLLAHPVLGAPIRDWSQRRAVRRPVKWKASLSMMAVLALSALLDMGAAILAVQAMVLACVALFLWTRPE